MIHMLPVTVEVQSPLERDELPCMRPELESIPDPVRCAGWHARRGARATGYAEGQPDGSTAAAGGPCARCAST